MKLRRPSPLASMIILLLAACALRIVGWLDAPPGMSYDEMTVVVEADDIRMGDRPIYMDGSAEEPLYHYLVAIAQDTIGPTLFAQRWLSAMLSLISVAAIYTLGRQMFNVRVGLFAAAFSAAAFWALMYGRMGLRIVALPAFVLLAILSLWKGIQAVSHQKSAAGKISLPSSLLFPVAGILFGLSAYTYSATRLIPVIFIGFFIYLLLFHRSLFRAIALKLTLTLIAALAIAAPMAIHIATVPVAERRLGEVEGPLDALRRGEVSPLINSTLITIGMFAFTGDPESLYNIPNRPVFDALTGAIFYLGVVWCLKRMFSKKTIKYPERSSELAEIASPSKNADDSNIESTQRPHRSTAIDPEQSEGSISAQDAHAFLLIWLFVGLVPPMSTWPAASNSHGVLAQSPTFLIAAIGLDAIAGKLSRVTLHVSRITRHSLLISFAFAALALIIHSLHSIIDYFGIWANLPGVRTEYAADMTFTAQYFARHPSSTPLVFSSGDVTHFNPWSAAAFRLIAPIGYRNARWFDARSSFIFPQGAADLTLINSVNDDAPAPLDNRLIEDLFPIVESSPFATSYFSATHLVSVLDTRLITLARSAVRLPFDVKSDQTLSLPVSFGDRADLIGYEVRRSIVQPGKNIRLTTYWRAQNIGLRPLSIFVHVLNDRHDIAAQWDGFTIDQHYVQAGDIIVQVHFIGLAPDFPEGAYGMELGLYDTETGVRVPIEIDGQAAADRILLQSIQVEK